MRHWSRVKPGHGQPRGRDGIGRRARFRSWWASARGGSSPSARIADQSTRPAANAKHESGGGRCMLGECERRAVDLGHRVPGAGRERRRALVDAAGRPGIRRLVGSHGVQLPFLGASLEAVLASIVELDARSCDQVTDRPRSQHLGWLGKCADLSADVNRDALEVLADRFALTRVDSRSDLCPRRRSSSAIARAQRTARLGPSNAASRPFPGFSIGRPPKRSSSLARPARGAPRRPDARPGGLQEGVERDHPEQLEAINAGIDRFFDSLPARRAEQPDRFVAELHEALPERYAKQAEAIYLRHATSSKYSPE